MSPKLRSSPLRRTLRDLDGLLHLFSALVIAWLIGHYGWHFSYVVFIVLVIYRVDRRRQKKELFRHTRQLILEEKNKPVILAAEEVTWINTLLAKMLPNISQLLSQTTEEKLKEILKDYLSNSKPPGVDSIKVNALSYGDIPPKIQKIKAFNTAKDFQMEFSVDYPSDFKIVLEIALGGRFIKSPSLSVAIQNIELSGRMRIQMSFCDSSPFVDSFRLAFKSCPDLKVTIKPMKAFNLNLIPGFEAWLVDTLKDVLVNMLVLPNRLTVHLRPPEPSQPPPQVSDSPESIEPPKEEDPMLLPEEKKMSRTPSFFRREKKPKVSKAYEAVLKVKLIEAKDLAACDSNGYSDPYCVLSTGSHERKSKMIKKTLSPRWDEDLELLIEEGAPKTLVVTVMDWDFMDDDDLIGTFEFDISTLVPGQTKDVWGTVGLETKEERGKIHLALLLEQLPGKE